VTEAAQNGSGQGRRESIVPDGWVSLLELIPGAAAEVQRRHPEVVSRLRAPALEIARGNFDMRTITARFGEDADVLILDGLLLARLDAGRARVGWLLGTDDLIRPSEMDAGLTRLTDWSALEVTRLAVLDADFARRAAPVPGVMSELLLHAHRTSHWLVTKALLVSSPSVEERLMFLFALLGERWAKVTPEGIYLPLRLTHTLIASLVGARRPTVTVALGSLQQKEIITRDSRGGWWLRPSDLLGRPTGLQEHTDALGRW
jgi:CRP/FNR family transcriptional regulator, cyclic AMP receptor protein